MVASLPGNPTIEDITQEAMVAAIERPPGHGNLRAWLARVTRNLAIAMPFLAGGVTVLTVGFLMIANFPYYSFKTIELRRRVPFAVVIAVVFVFGLVTLDPPSILLAGFAAYALSGPVMLVLRRRRRRG